MKFLLPLLGASFLALQASTGAPSSSASPGPERTDSRPAASPESRSTAAPNGLAAADWSSIRAAYEANRHKFFPTEKGWQARNPGLGLLTVLDERGFLTKPEDGAWNWGLELVGYGWGEAQKVASAPNEASALGSRFARRWDHRLTEWYVNDQRGLEHGFSIASRPMDSHALLTLELSVRGGLRPTVSMDQRNISFMNSEGGYALSYNGLVVLDAAGHSVPARWKTTQNHQLRLEIEDAGAQYPLTIDPIVQLAYLKASNTDANDSFGVSVAVSGNTVVVGAHQESSKATGVNGNQADNSASFSGAAYVFVRTGKKWSQQAYLKASNTETGDLFGWSVSVSGDIVVVGAPREDSNAVGINGNQSNNSAGESGAAYVFVRTGTTWTQRAYLKASNTGVQDDFGESVAVSGSTVVVGARTEDSGATGVNGDQASNSFVDSGAAYVFVRTGLTFTQQAYLKASNTGVIDQFGAAVAVSGDTVVVGAFLEDSDATGVNGNQFNNNTIDSGAVYVFVRSGTTWTQQAYLKASNSGMNDNLGWSVAVSGDTVVVGAIFEDSGATGVNGNGADNSVINSGAAYVFERTGNTWAEQAYLKASNPDAHDLFGICVAVSGDTVVVGARGESSNAAGVNGIQSDNSAGESGAAYVFVRTGSSWMQQAYLKASNNEKGDYNGESVAVSGDTVVVGARLEGSAATGVNGNQLNNSATGSGATYVFDLDINPGTTAYGTGTPGCSGVQTLDVTQAPMIGSPQFGITCNNAPPSSIGLGLLGDAYDLPGSDAFGSGILIHIDLLASKRVIPFDFTSDPAGNAIAPAPIPFDASLVGLTYFAQAIWRWTSCPLPPFNLSSSQGLAITVLFP